MKKSGYKMMMGGKTPKMMAGGRTPKKKTVKVAPSAKAWAKSDKMADDLRKNDSKKRKDRIAKAVVVSEGIKSKIKTKEYRNPKLSGASSVSKIRSTKTIVKQPPLQKRDPKPNTNYVSTASKKGRVKKTNFRKR